MSRGTLDTALLFVSFAYGTFTLYGPAFQPLILLNTQNHYASPQPQTTAVSLVWALPLSLATTYGITFVFSSCGYLDVSVPHVPSCTLCIHVRVPEHLPQVGFPIRTSTGQWLFAPPRGFSQLIASFIGSLVPRHSPYALISLTFLSVNSKIFALAYIFYFFNNFLALL